MATPATIRNVFDANYLGMVRVIRAALPLLRKQGRGHILGVSSGLGITSLPIVGFYSATKVGSGGDARGAGAGGQSLRYQGHAG